MRRRGFRFMDDDTGPETPDVTMERCDCGGEYPYDPYDRRTQCEACDARDAAEEAAVEVEQ